MLIETILAAFEMDEILYELREHSAGLNCGRWDYIFSCIKKFGSDPNFVLADRALVTMTTHFMRSYSLLAIKTCHRRDVHAMGGMAAQIPIKNDPEANEQALAKVRADKEREATDGHDGTWVAHPGLVPIALEVFDKHMPGPNQIDRKREDVNITAADLLEFEPRRPDHRGRPAHNINVGIQYLGLVAGGQRLRADLQSHGGRRHRRDLALPGLAVDPQPARRARRRPQGRPAAGPARSSPKSSTKILAERDDDPTGNYTRAAELFARSWSRSSSRTS